VDLPNGDVAVAAQQAAYSSSRMIVIDDEIFATASDSSWQPGLFVHGAHRTPALLGGIERVVVVYSDTVLTKRVFAPCMRTFGLARALATSFDHARFAPVLVATFVCGMVPEID
jgi:hypothetical protein